jgi:hypothetical protein
MRSDFHEAEEVASLTVAHAPARLHRAAHVADWLDTSISTVRRLVRLGKLDSVYIGASLRITDGSVRALANAGTRRSKPRGKK